MGVKVSALVPTVTDTVEINGQTVTVTFNKTGDTAEFDREVYSLLVGEQWALYIEKVVTEWDVQQDDGSMWPLEAESLKKLPTDILRKVGRFIQNHDLGKGLSSNGSSPEG